MITIGFRSKFSGIIRAVAALVMGILMLIHPEGCISLIVKVLACFLMASGLVSLVFGIYNRKNRGVELMYVNSAVDIALGILIFIFSGFVGQFILYLLGACLLLFGIYQIVIMVSLVKHTGINLFMFALPGLAAIGGALILFHPFSQSVMGIIAGVALLIYGISELLATWKVQRAVDGIQDDDFYDSSVDEQ